MNIDAMKFGFAPNRDTTDAILIVRQFQEEFSERKSRCDLKKAFDMVSKEAQRTQRFFHMIKRLAKRKKKIQVNRCCLKVEESQKVVRLI